MKTTLAGDDFLTKWGRIWARGLLLAGFLTGLLPNLAPAESLYPGTNYSRYLPLDTWSFSDTNDWTSDDGYAPLSFTNLTSSDLGDGSVLMVDNPGGPAWLQFGVTNADGTTNLTVDIGSVMFWYAPDWSGTNVGGGGPQVWARLLEAGGYTPDSSLGWWSLYLDPPGQNLCFSAQTNDFSSNVCTYVTAPVLFTTNFWHFIAFTYSTTNTALYIDGELATNGPPITNYPGPAALAGGFFIGSDANGFNQAGGMIDDLATYDYPVSPRAIANTFLMQSIFYYGNFLNQPELSSAPSSPSYGITYDVISGAGDLGSGVSASCNNDGANEFDVWITNVTATATSITFSLGGGWQGIPYDVFANSGLAGTNLPPWAWMGQAYRCKQYTLSGLPSTGCFLILGTPLGTNGLTYAYEQLVLGISGYGPQSDSYGVPYAWYAENGLLPLTGSLATQDPDADGLLNYQEYQYGTKPQVSEGFSVWVSTPAGSSAIP